MLLDLDRTPGGRSNLEIEETLSLGPEDSGTSSVKLSGTLVIDNLESRMLVTGTLVAAGESDCDRCLEDFSLECDIPVEILVLRDAEVDDATETCVVHQKRGELDLHAPLRESLLLAWPQKRLCREDCRGLCPQCGANRNLAECDCTDEEIDPRWEGLP